MMDLDALSARVEEVIRSSEVRAVVNSMLAGNPVRPGQIIDYVIEFPQPSSADTVQRRGSDRKRPYRVAVEQWHLDAANGILYERRCRSTVDPTGGKLGVPQGPSSG